MNISNPALRARPGKHLTFVLGGESYGIEVVRVREIVKLQRVTPVPQVSDCIRGVINLRGRVIPVVDLRVKLGLPRPVDTEQSCIIVVQATVVGEQPRPMGLIVDAVEEVMSFAAEDIEPPPQFGSDAGTGSILGMAKLKGQVKMLLDLDRILNGDMLPRTLLSASEFSPSPTDNVNS